MCLINISLTGYRFLPAIAAAETRNSAGDNHHQADADGAHDEEQLEVDLAVLAGKPGVAVTADLGLGQHALPVPVAQLALSGGPGADAARQQGLGRDVQVAGHAAA